MIGLFTYEAAASILLAKLICPKRLRIQSGSTFKVKRADKHVMTLSQFG